MMCNNTVNLCQLLYIREYGKIIHNLTKCIVQNLVLLAHTDGVMGYKLSIIGRTEQAQAKILR
jgi:hypothetical protein